MSEERLTLALERLYAELGIVSHFLESMSSSDVVTTAGGSLIQ